MVDIAMATDLIYIAILLRVSLLLRPSNQISFAAVRSLHSCEMKSGRIKNHFTTSTAPYSTL